MVSSRPVAVGVLDRQGRHQVGAAVAEQLVRAEAQEVELVLERGEQQLDLHEDGDVGLELGARVEDARRVAAEDVADLGRAQPTVVVGVVEVEVDGQGDAALEAGGDDADADAGARLERGDELDLGDVDAVGVEVVDVEALADHVAAVEVVGVGVEQGADVAWRHGLRGQRLRVGVEAHREPALDGDRAADERHDRHRSGHDRAELLGVGDRRGQRAEVEPEVRRLALTGEHVHQLVGVGEERQREARQLPGHLAGLGADLLLGVAVALAVGVGGLAGRAGLVLLVGEGVVVRAGLRRGLLGRGARPAAGRGRGRRRGHGLGALLVERHVGGVEAQDRPRLGERLESDVAVGEHARARGSCR